MVWHASKTIPSSKRPSISTRAEPHRPSLQQKVCHKRAPRRVL
ncbi:hypothetical protein X946_5198 [Burkholderia sp. ABCPW 111]|nr:hypothetical protein X946_5198 [Burkholderia sp. ABCPW 111]